ncbi:MAG: hypothetical protein ABIG84_02270 [archaeon]
MVIMYKEKKRDYIRSKEYMTHKTPEQMKQDYEGENIERTYKDASKEELLYKIANRPVAEIDDDEKPEIVPDSIKIMQREAVPREDPEEVRQLRCAGSQIIGNLFDRVGFLEERIAEISKAVELRNQIHEEIIKDIDGDIQDKELFATKCIDFDDLRSIKLHISMLRQQKRKELIQRFHDNIALTTELRALREEYHSEKKIASIFDGAGAI